MVKTFKKILTLTVFTATIIMLYTTPTTFAEPWHENEEVGYGIPFDPIIIIDVDPWTPPVITLPEFPIFKIITEFDYFLWTEHGGWWYDAEKTLDNTDDDLMCWAASCSNALEWTGWGIVNDPTNGLLEDTDEMFQNFNFYWADDGGFMSQGWDWWFDGTEYGDIDTYPSGDYWASETYVDYYDEEWTQSLTLQRIDEILHRGDSVTIGIRPVSGSGGHAITAWGYRYNSLKNKNTETAEYYIGIWVTDSDDNKGSNTADPPPNTLRYYDLVYNSTSNRWVLDNYGGGWYIEAVMSLAPKPGETRPLADAGSNMIVYEGISASFNGSSSSDDDALEYRWDFNEDFLWDTTWSSSPSSINTWPDNLADPVKVSLEVYDGVLKDVDQISVTVQNVAPTITPLSDYIVDEGDSFIKYGSFTDPGDDTWTATVDYGEGDGEEILALSGKSFTLNHVYEDNGNYTVEVTITDDDGGIGTETFIVTVNNVAPLLSDINIANVNENGYATLSGTISDPGILDEFNLTIDWGEESPVEYSYVAGTTSFSESHQYLDDNPTGTASDIYIVSLTIVDDDGGSDAESTSLTIYNLEPVANAGIDQTVDEGDIVSFSGSLSDTGSADTHTTTWDFGDSSPVISGTLTPTHVYADEGNYVVTFTVTDDDGGTTSDTLIITVYNVAPTITNLTTDQPNPQFILPDVHQINFTADFQDPGWLDTHTAFWDYGDDSVESGIIQEENVYPDSTGTVIGSHTYSAPGNFTVQLTVTDNDGGSTTQTFTIEIVTIEEAVSDLDGYIQGLDDSYFTKKAKNQKRTLDRIFDSIQDKLVEFEYQGAINHLSVVRSMVDGEGIDWLADLDTQEHLLMKIDDIIEYLYTLL